MGCDELFWKKLLEDLNTKRVLLFISNSMVLNSVFCTTGCKHSASNIEEQIAARWADDSHYPLSDKYNLANVAQFNFFNGEDEIETKKGYINVCKELLIDHLKECQPNKFEMACDRKLVINDYFSTDITLSEIFKELDLPDWGTEMVLSKLAEIKTIKYYFTTSYFNLLERALEKQRKDWYSQVYDDPIVYFNGTYDETRQDINFLTIEQPFVYYLFGNDNNAEKMTLTEDDHINFLTGVSKSVIDRTVASHTSLPGYIKNFLNDTTLLFLGYRWQDWEFRTLFRYVNSPDFTLPHNRRTKTKNNIIIQLDPDFNDRIEQATKTYGESYFSRRRLVIIEKGTKEFVDDLSQRWYAPRG